MSSYGDSKDLKTGMYVVKKQYKDDGKYNKRKANEISSLDHMLSLLIWYEFA